MKPMSGPLVSIIIPCYNYARLLPEAVESALAQTYGPIEVVIVNDGSTDDTEAVAKRYVLSDPRVKVVNKANGGLADARNAGVRASGGQYILPLDADDRIGPNYLAAAVPLLEADETLGVVYCQVEYFGGKNELWALPDFEIGRMLACNQVVCSGVYRRIDFDRVGGYDTRLKACYEDWDFWLGILETGRRFVRLPDVHFYYRYRADSMIRSVREENKAALRQLIYRKHLDLYLAHSDPFVLMRKLIAVQDCLDAVLKSRSYRLGHAAVVGVKRLFRRGGGDPHG